MTGVTCVIIRFLFSCLTRGLSFLSLTVTDSDGATNSTQATLLVNKAKDYRPVANAGPNQVTSVVFEKKKTF